MSNYSLHFDKQQRAFEENEINESPHRKPKKKKEIGRKEKPNYEMTEDELKINEEEDIAQIIDGLKNILHNCL